ncbi:uncharacterized protein [Macrobrachium rosenbergii]|uniref:uncharacterized protein n=1 Tax=Macrobrachium rosenbergii TaxID=79674 RepID=UPI0034D67D32
MQLNKWIVWWLAVSQIVNSLVQLRKGAIIKEHGKVKMIQDLAIVKIQTDSIIDQREQLVQLSNQIQAGLQSVQDRNLYDMLSKLQRDIDSVMPRKVVKRSLIPFIGVALHNLFGVATDGNVERLKERVAQLENWASEQGTVYNKVIGNVNQNQKMITVLKEFVNSALHNVSSEIARIHQTEMMEQLLIETSNFLLEYKELLNAIMMAGKNLLSPFLITPSEIEAIIQKCVVNNHLKPLVENIVDYYGLITVKVVANQIILVIPFNNPDVNSLMSVYPFPMVVDNKSIVLEGTVRHFALQHDSFLVTEIPEHKFRECVMLNDGVYVCNIVNFYEPLSALHCLDDLVNNKNGKNHCKYIPFTETFKAQIIDDEIFVFSANRLNAKIDCKSNKTEVVFINVHSFSSACELVILHNLYYKPTVFTTYSLNFSKSVHQFAVINEFQLSELELETFTKLEEVHTFFHTYKTEISPIMSFINVILLVLFAFISFMIVRKLILNKLTIIKDMMDRILPRE